MAAAFVVCTTSFVGRVLLPAILARLSHGLLYGLLVQPFDSWVREKVPRLRDMTAHGEVLHVLANTVAVVASPGVGALGPVSLGPSLVLNVRVGAVEPRLEAIEPLHIVLQLPCERMSSRYPLPHLG
jgi:hypothetical protein